ncbi:MAG: hypothetical protein BZY88_19955 [SAR202 cluster bacterium Io17-Chloro-G9]|nr:MAG: hypothetical protein BZY88_19955 [SAR202 cluster bacterium Io17-Chloro-G9]
MADEIITMDDMAAIFAVTDDMGIHRESVRVDLTKEDPGSIGQGAGGLIEITIPSSTPTQNFALELKAKLESMGFLPGQPGGEEEDEPF